MSRLSDTTILNPITVIDSTQNYILNISNNFGCHFLDTTTISATNLVIVDAGDSSFICIGDSVNLQATGNTSFDWGTSPSLSCQYCSSPTATPSTTTTYYLQPSTPSSCSNQDSVVVIVNPIPSAQIQADSLVCTGDTIQLTALTTDNITWITNAWISDSTSSTPSTYIDTTHQYILNTYNSFGCQAFDTIEIIAEAVLWVNAGDSLFVCNGESVVLQATGNTGFDWGLSPSLSCQFCPNPIANPSNTSTYYLQPSISSNCFNIDSITVVVYPQPIAQITGNNSICIGDSVFLEASGGQLYNWLVGENLSSNSISNPFAIPISSNIYTVEIIDSNNCKDSISYPVTVLDRNFSPIPDATICLGDSAVLTVTNGNNPIWQGDSLSCYNCTQTSASPNSSSQYIVSYNNSNNCPVQDSITINIIDLSQLQALSSDTICLGDSIQLNVLGHNGANISWHPNYALSNNNIPNPFAYPSVDTQYTVNLNQGQCNRSDSVFIKIHTPSLIQAPDIGYCIGDTAQLFASGNVNNYTWSPSIYLSDSSISNPLVYSPVNQQYQVVGNGRCNVDTAYANIVVHQYPTMQLDSSINAMMGTTVIINTQADPSHNFVWSPDADLSCTNCPNPSWLVDGNQTFYVTISNNFGCSRMDSITIKFFEECTADLVFVPSAFTPDNDGHNDLLFAQSGIIQEIEAFQIYSRWGQLVFESNDLSEGWDGTFQGKALSPDVFGYFIVFNCPNTGEKMLKKGNVTILR